MSMSMECMKKFVVSKNFNPLSKNLTNELFKVHSYRISLIGHVEE